MLNLGVGALTRSSVARAWPAGLALFAALTWGAPDAGAQTLAALPKLEPAARIEPTGVARPVQGWVKFCARNPAECAVDVSEPATVPLNGKTWKTLNAVNKQVNGSIKPKTDMEHWGTIDRWDLPDDGFGDCEDYQLLKRKILVEQHRLPRRALRMTVVIDDQGEGHAVLLVRTDEGDIVLDNKRGGILPWNETGYMFVKREGQDGDTWVSLGDRSSPITTANR